MSDTIRILHVLGGTDLGGAESRIMDLYRQMDPEQFQFDFLVHSDAVRHAGDDASARKPQFYDEEILRRGGQIYVLPRFKGYNYMAYRRAVVDFFARHHEFRVVQGHMTSTAAIYLPIAKRAGVPITAAHARSAGVDSGIKGIATRLLRKNLYRKADFCFACSHAAGVSAFGEKAVNDGRVTVIPNAVDAERYVYQADRRKQMRKQLRVEDKLVLGHVGRFHESKNHDYLVSVFAQVCKAREDAALILVGDGPGREAVSRKCRELGIADKVLFAGNQRNPEDYYQAFDFFLLPSLYEGLPGVLIEAQAAGLRCLVSDTVTREAQITDLVTYMSIRQPARAWAEEILSQIGYERRNTCEEIVKSGFDVETQAAGYRKFYQNGDGSAL